MHDWFPWYVRQVKKRKGWLLYRERYLCPCCFMPTLGVRAAYELCGLCDWEDDGQDSDDADVARGGPNGNYSLREARENFKQYFTMYRPADTHAFVYDQMERPAREWLHRYFSITMFTESDEHWQKALAIERELAALQRRQEQGRH